MVIFTASVCLETGDLVQLLDEGNWTQFILREEEASGTMPNLNCIEIGLKYSYQ